MLKFLFFLAFLTQKLAPSNVLNDIIFAIDEQCNLIFETILFTNRKSYIIFLFSGAHFLFFFFFLISVSCFTISLLSLSLCSSSLPPSPTKPKLKHQAKPIFFYLVNTLSLSLLYLSLSFLTSFFSLLSLWFADEWVPLMTVLRRLWDADGCGSVVVMEVSSFSFFLFFFVWFFLGSIGLRSCEADTKRHAIKSLIRFWVLIWWGWVLI